MKTVLHLASHMGGGVGKVLSNVAISEDSTFDHHIVLLEKPIDTVFTDKLTRAELTVAPSIDVIRELAEYADICSFEWWNHPLMASLMYNLRDVQMRSVVWSHTAGCYYPYIKPDFVSLPDAFIFSSQYSADNPHWTLEDRSRMYNIFFINSSGGFKDTKDVPLVPHEGFNVGYVGTLGYVKLFPQFVEWCKSVSDIPGIRFVMVGRIPEPNRVLKDAEEFGIADKFVFKGWVQDLPAEIAQFDVLAYLLNQHHFGTTENAMLEAMSMGVPPVCIDQCAEKYLIKDDYSGMLVNSKPAFKNVITAMYADKELRDRIGLGARVHVLTRLELENTVHKLDNVYKNVMGMKKRIVPFDEVFGSTPYQWYQAGCSPAGTEFSKFLTDSSKGSVAQWHKYYPGDKRLAALVGK